ncbi:MAG: sigma-70 family RNA polymerase sigma factor [Armatimonadia bacterium]|nr:sigma-70 family RNA polymerase sigma factor [Armatimonadia bacterium]
MDAVGHSRRPVSDDELGLRAQDGDTDAREELVKRYTWLARTLATQYRVPGTERVDTEQTAMMGLLDAIKYFRLGGMSFRNHAWLHMKSEVFTAIKSADCRKGRANHRDLVLIGDFDSEASGTFADRSPTQPEATIVRRDLLREAQGRFSQMEWDVTRLFALGYSYEEIGERLGIEWKQVDNALTRARRKGDEILECA